jgi:hypothetical protein
MKKHLKKTTRRTRLPFKMMSDPLLSENGSIMLKKMHQKNLAGLPFKEQYFSNSLRII